MHILFPSQAEDGRWWGGGGGWRVGEGGRGGGGNSLDAEGKKGLALTSFRGKLNKTQKTLGFPDRECYKHEHFRLVEEKRQGLG